MNTDIIGTFVSSIGQSVTVFGADVTLAPISLSHDERYKLKALQVKLNRAGRFGSDALAAGRAKAVSACKKIVTDNVDNLQDIDNYMALLAECWGVGIDATVVPDEVKFANSSLMDYRKLL